MFYLMNHNAVTKLIFFSDWLYFALFTEISIVVVKIIKTVKISELLHASHFYSILIQLSIICISSLSCIDIITISKIVRAPTFFPNF